MSDDDPILEGLNPPQREAVVCNDGPLLILAGAGSGKTRAITHKIAWLVAREGYFPAEILALTFTNRAAGEMRERAEAMLGESAEGLWLGTFHRIGVRVLRRHGELLGIDRSFVIYDADDQKAMVKRCIEDLGWSTEHVQPKSVQGFINEAKQRALDPDEVAQQDGRSNEDRYLRVYRHYEDAMRRAGAVDFGDLIDKPLRLLQQHPVVASEYRQRWQYVLVDEFQDTNRAQYMLLRAALNDARRICVVGDDDQSIYGWRGAEVENILEFDQDFPETRVVRLECNYRSQNRILEAADALIQKNAARHPKRLWTDRPDGEPVRMHRAPSDRDEAQWVVRRIRELQGEHPLHEMAIFYRTHAQSRPLEEALRREGLPYRIVGGLKFYQRAEIKDVLAYLRALLHPNEVVSFERIINTPPRRIGAATVRTLHDRAAADGTSFWEACRTLARSGTKAQRTKLGPFVELMEGLQELARERPAVEVVKALLDRTGIRERLRQDGTAESDARLENLDELVSAVEDFGQRSGDTGLEAFLEDVALVADVDRADLDRQGVVMMTAHTAKGLEFDVVFLTGLEEGIFPHFNALEQAQGREEERRLAYVAMTRARERLHLSTADYRRRFGRIEASTPSTFLDDLPMERIEVELPARPGGLSGSRLAGSPGRSSGREAGGKDLDDLAQPMPDYEDESQERGGLRPQATVFHPKFGEGRILELSGEGHAAKARVRFATGEERRIVARFLTPV